MSISIVAVLATLLPSCPLEVALEKVVERALGAELESTTEQVPLAELAARIDAEGDRVAPALLREVARQGNQAAFDLLAHTYAEDRWRTTGKVRLLRALSEGSESEWFAERALEMLASAFDDEEEERLRIAALESAAKFESKAAPLILKAVAADVDSKLREAALEALFESGDRRAEPLARHLFDADEFAAPEGVAAIAEVTEELRVAAFERAVESLDTEVLKLALDSLLAPVRVAALEALTDRADPIARERADVTFDASPDKVHRPERIAAARALIRADGIDGYERVLESGLAGLRRPSKANGLRWSDWVAELFRAEPNPEFTDSILYRLRKTKAGETRFYLRMLRGVGEDERIDKLLLKVMDDKSPLVRIEALQMLGERGVTEALREAVEDRRRDEPERALAIDCWRDAAPEDPALRESLLKLATSEKLSDARATALRVLAEIGVEDISVFDTALEGDEWTAKVAAVHALKHLRTPESTGKLVAALGSDDLRFEAELTKALASLTGQGFDTNVAAWQRWWNDHGADFTPLDAEHAAELEVMRSVDSTGDTVTSPTAATSFFGIPIESQHIAFVVDVSGSMVEPIRKDEPGSKTRLEVVQAELEQALEALPEEALFNLILFSEKARPVFKELVPAEPRSIEKAVHNVMKVNASGGTNFYDALTFALSDLEVDTIVFLTDGQPSTGAFPDVGDIERLLLKRCARRGVRVHGIAADGGLSVLARFALGTGGTFREL